MSFIRSYFQNEIISFDDKNTTIGELIKHGIWHHLDVTVVCLVSIELEIGSKTERRGPAFQCDFGHIRRYTDHVFTVVFAILLVEKDKMVYQFVILLVEKDKIVDQYLILLVDRIN